MRLETSKHGQTIIAYGRTSFEHCGDARGILLLQVIVARLIRTLDICRIVSAHLMRIMRILPTLLLMASLLIHSSYAASQFHPAAKQFRVVSDTRDEIPTVDFCEMVKDPRPYFDKTVRLTATYEMATEAQYLSDVRCVLSHDDQIGVRYVNADEKPPNILSKYGGNPARVTVVGILRNSSLRAFAWYRYRFDIIRFEEVSREDISRMINSYGGTLREGVTYRATVSGDKGSGLSLVPSLRVLENQAARVEWTNLNEFPALKRLRGGSSQGQIVFSVISDQISQITGNRWNRTLRCKVIIVE